MNASDVMTRNVLSVRPDGTIAEAIRLAMTPGKVSTTIRPEVPMPPSRQLLPDR